jgi:hypothetical protein
MEKTVLILDSKITELISIGSSIGQLSSLSFCRNDAAWCFN